MIAIWVVSGVEMWGVLLEDKREKRKEISVCSCHLLVSGDTWWSHVVHHPALFTLCVIILSWFWFICACYIRHLSSLHPRLFCWIVSDIRVQSFISLKAQGSVLMSEWTHFETRGLFSLSWHEVCLRENFGQVVCSTDLFCRQNVAPFN